MASLTNTLQVNYRIRDKDLNEDVRKEVQTIKTSTVYQRDRITLAASASAVTHSFAPTSGIGHMIVHPLNGGIDIKFNETGVQIGLAASSALPLITRGSGNNTTEITSLGLYNPSATQTVDVDIIHTD